MVEAAFVMPVFVLMLMGIFEFAGYVMARTGANAAVKAGARMASVQGAASMADREILNRMLTEGAGIRQDDIEQVVIMRAPEATDPALLKSFLDKCTALTSGYHTGISDGGVGSDSVGACNVYNDVQDAVGAYTKANLPIGDETDPTKANYWFGCDPGAAGAGDTTHPRYDCQWSPQNRRQKTKSPEVSGTCSESTANRRYCPPDRILIAIKVKHYFYTTLFGDSATVTSQSVVRIEPQEYDK